VTFSAPAPLTEHHNTESFDCGVDSLNQWLKRRALKNQITGGSRTFVVCEGRRVLAYYALASGAVVADGVTGKFGRNMPDPIPVIVLARLAVDHSRHGKGWGRALIRDVAMRAVRAADLIGVRGLIVHALSAEAKGFYEQMGFEPSPLDPMMLQIVLADLGQGS
jgi:GNAT superfamily N-acetyltransferase